MKKLFLLVFTGLFMMLSFITPALAENAPLSPEEEYALLKEESSGALEADPGIPQQTSEENLGEEGDASEETITLPEDILTADCTVFYEAEDIINIEEEELYKKQSIFIKNLEFAQQSNFRLDPNDQSLIDLNGSFLQSNFTEERLSALDALKERYASSINYCLESQARAIAKKRLAEIKDRENLRIEEIEKNTKEALLKAEKRREVREATIARKKAKRLQKIQREARATQKAFKKRVNQAYSQVYSGKKASLFNKTIVTLENKLDRLPAFVESREKKVIALSNRSLDKAEKNAARSRAKITQKEREKVQDLQNKTALKRKKVQELLDKTLEKAPEKAATKADSTYKNRREAVIGEGAIIGQRVIEASEIINYLQNLWNRDRKKNLPRLDITSLDLNSEEITVQGLLDPKVSNNERRSANKKSKKEARKIKQNKSGKKDTSNGLNRHKSKAKESGRDRRGKNGGFVGNIDRIWTEHNSANGDWGGPTLPSYVVAALAQAAGMPGITMEQVTRGESGAHKKNSARPGATGVDPGGTKGYGLWMITTSFNDNLAKKVGGYKKFLNPVLNAWAAAQIYKSNGLGAWYGTRSVRGDGINYKGKYDLRKALGGRTYKQVLASYGIGKK